MAQIYELVDMILEFYGYKNVSMQWHPDTPRRSWSRGEKLI